MAGWQLNLLQKDIPPSFTFQHPPLILAIFFTFNFSRFRLPSNIFDTDIKDCRNKQRSAYSDRHLPPPPLSQFFFCQENMLEDKEGRLGKEWLTVYVFIKEKSTFGTARGHQGLIA